MADRLSFTVPSTNTPTAPPIGAQFGEAIVKSVPLAKIKPFPNHPFLVVEDADLRQLADSIRDHGIQEPVMLRPIGEFQYQLLSGHRRCKAAELAGLICVPAIIKPMTDDEATIYMVDANLHRPHILPSEKAKSYRMKMDALRHQGKRVGNTEQGSTASETWSANRIAQDAGESSRQVYRYVRLSNLIDRFLEMIDNSEKKVKPNPSDMVFTLTMGVGLTLADLTEEQQYLLLDCICRAGKVPTLSQAKDLQESAKNDTLSADFISSILNEREKKSEVPSFEQSFVDAALLSWYSENIKKYYASEPKAEFIKSVRHEYRDHASFGNGIGIDGQSDGLYIRSKDNKMRLTWTKLATRIGELIEQGRYINPNEKPKENLVSAEESVAVIESPVLCDTVAQSETQPEKLRQLKNKAERLAFIENYAHWGVWKEIPELRVKFYKYDLPNGARIIAQTYIHPSISYLSYHQEEHAVAEYALLLPKGDDYKGTFGQEYTFYRPNGASKSAIVDYLTTKKPLVRDYEDVD